MEQLPEEKLPLEVFKLCDLVIKALSFLLLLSNLLLFRGVAFPFLHRKDRVLFCFFLRLLGFFLLRF